MRLTVLLILAFYVSSFYFSYIKNTLRVQLNFYEESSGKIVNPNFFTNKLEDYRNKSDTLSPLITIPTPFLRYNLYAKNEVTFFKEQKAFKSIMSVHVEGSDYKQLVTGESKLISKKKIAFDEFYTKVANTPIRFRAEDEAEGYGVKFEASNYEFYLEPDKFSFLIVMLFAMPAIYAVFVVYMKIWNFISNGSPFIGQNGDKL